MGKLGSWQSVNARYAEIVQNQKCDPSLRIDSASRSALLRDVFMCASVYLYNYILFPGRFCPVFSEFVLAAGIHSPIFWQLSKQAYCVMTPISALISIVVDKHGHAELLTGLNLITAFYEELKRAGYCTSLGSAKLLSWGLCVYAAAFYLKHGYHFISGSRSSRAEIQACVKLQLQFNSDACRALTIIDEGFSLLLSSQPFIW